MNDALWGALIGAGATALVSLLSWAQQRSLRKLELETEDRKRHHETESQRSRDRKEQYVRFVSSYYVTEGRLLDLRDYLVAKPTGWLEHYQSVVRDQDHEQRTIALNEGRAWIALTTPSLETNEAVATLSKAFDQLGEEFQRAKITCMEGGECDVAKLDSAFASTSAAFEVALRELREDLGTGPLRSRALVAPK